MKRKLHSVETVASRTSPKRAKLSTSHSSFIHTQCTNKKPIPKRIKKSKNSSSKPHNQTHPTHSFVQCPLCNKSVLAFQINFHLDLECPKLKSQNNTHKSATIKNTNNTFRSKVTKCPKCGDTVLRTQINMHLDLDCEQQRKKWLKMESINTKQNIHTFKTAVPGLYLLTDFITAQESKDILSELNGHKWTQNRDSGLRGKRRCQHYGPAMDEMYRVVSHSKYFTELPPLCKQIGERISSFWNSCANIPTASLHNKLSVNANDFNELLVNEYRASDALLFHFDQRGAFEELLTGLSLCSASEMAFQHKSNDYDIIKVKLPPNSVYFMSGDSRYRYKHGFITGDIFGYRVSLTFRTVRAIFYGGKVPKKKSESVYTISTTKQLKLDDKFFAKSKKFEYYYSECKDDEHPTKSSHLLRK